MSKLFADLMEKQLPSPSPENDGSPTLEKRAEAKRKEMEQGKEPGLSSRPKEPQPSGTVNETVTPRYHDTTPPRIDETVKPRDDDARQSRNEARLIETIRKAVRQIGKESATHRFTPEEKRMLAGIIYAYKARGIRTSENEIARIGLNFLMEDYQAHRELSILARVLEELNE